MSFDNIEFLDKNRILTSSFEYLVGLTPYSLYL
uniref:Uncharacterized protein n=1 Tax=Klebsiella pneumoniae TaxID=573 RepID=A7KG09_KLEPN|nr:hypothetical protein [Klebsiella pneumoniae]